ncbi:MAG: FAD-binding protein [Alphaproteobacteria bacterium]
MAILAPADANEVRDAVGEAVAAGASLAVEGGGTKRGYGRPVEAAHRLSLARLDGIVDYQPSELVLTARAGTPLATIEALLAQHGQQLAFEPPDTSDLLGPGAPTLGGIVACNLSGPRRLRAGACRDHVLGVHAVTGRAEAIKAGGKVVKNVTGYDLPKLFTGSFGTLAVLTEITVKVLPRPAKTRTILAYGLDVSAALAAMTALMAGPLEPSGLAYLPAAVAARSGVGYVNGAGRSVTAARIEGPPASTLVRAEAVRRALAKAAPVEELHGRNSAALWREIGFAALLAQPADCPVWRLALPPAAGAEALAALEAAGAEAFLDLAGGRLWAALPDGLADAGASAVRAVSGHAGGLSTLVRAPDALRATIDVFEPQPAPLALLTRRVKDTFDPARVLEPGRMVAGV